MTPVGEPILDFSRRSRARELMDDEEVTAEDFAACLRDLDTVNTVTLARPPTLRWLERLRRRTKLQRLTILDVGFGHGDMLRAIRAWARGRGVEADLIGVDLNPWSAQAARAATPAEDRILYHTGDVFDFEPDRPVDVIVSSIFAHHLDDDQLTRFLAWSEARAIRGWFVNDLHRHPIAYHGFKWLARAARWHRFVQHDGPVSVARSFVRADWERQLAAAGIPRGAAEIRWHVPFRYCVGRVKP
jgi:SAM-dependent methyltransferase